MEEIESRSGEVYLLQELYKYFSSPVHLERDERISGVFGWAVLILIILAYDIYSIRSKKIETLTRSFWRLSDHKIKKIPVLATWLVLSFHLLGEKHVRRKLVNSR